MFAEGAVVDERLLGGYALGKTAILKAPGDALTASVAAKREALFARAP